MCFSQNKVVRCQRSLLWFGFLGVHFSIVIFLSVLFFSVDFRRDVFVPITGLKNTEKHIGNSVRISKCKTNP